MHKYQFFLYRIVSNEKLIIQSSEILENLNTLTLPLFARKFFFECGSIKSNKHPHDDYFVYAKILEDGYSFTTEPIIKGRFNFSRLIHDITYLIPSRIENMNNKVGELEESI